MLVLSRRPGQGVILGNSIRIKIVEANGRVVRLGIEAPPEVSIYRDELHQAIAQANQSAIMPEDTEAE